MFGNLFGWRKASKCKKLIMGVQCRIKLLKNKRCCIVRQLREDVSQLLKNGHHDLAFKLAEHIFKDESIVAVYELLDYFCEFITIHLSYIRRRKDCPNDINEAISSLIFASARCGDLPELRAIRKLFEERYGQRFAMSAVELYPGNLVNSQVKEKLSIKLVSDDMKQRLVNEIARLNSLQQQEMVEHETQASSNIRKKEMNEEALFGDSSTNKNKIMSEQCYSYQDSGTSSSTSSNTVVHHCFQRKAESQMHQNVVKVENSQQPYSPFPIRSHGRIDAVALEQEKGADEKSSSETSNQYPEEAVVYLDDIEEFQSPKTQDSSCQDQRLFLFNSFHLSKRESMSEADQGEGYGEQYDSRNKTGSERSKRTEKGVRKRVRKRTMHHENQSIKDIEYEVYYDGSFGSSSDQGKHHKKIIKNGDQKGGGSSFATEKDRYDQLSRGSHNCELASDCSLEHPCYFSASDSKDELEVHSLQDREPKSPEMIRASLHPKYGRGDNTVDGANSVQQPPNQSKKAERVPRRSDNPGIHGSDNGTMISPWTKMATAPYLRAMTMPPERTRDNCNDNILRSNSFPVQQPCHLSHVHPKLPDYDDLAAKFTALKTAHRANKAINKAINNHFI